MNIKKQVCLNLVIFMAGFVSMYANGRTVKNVEQLRVLRQQAIENHKTAYEIAERTPQFDARDKALKNCLEFGNCSEDVLVKANNSFFATEEGKEFARCKMKAIGLDKIVRNITYQAGSDDIDAATSGIHSALYVDQGGGVVTDDTKIIREEVAKELCYLIESETSFEEILKELQEKKR